MVLDDSLTRRLISLIEDAVWPATDMRGRVTNPHSRMSDYLATYRDVIDADDQDFDFPRYTASLDAALALVERVLPGWGFYIRRNAYGCEAALVSSGLCGVTQPRIEAPTPALALCLALVRALQQGGGDA